jgi:hypothetical protein
MRRKATRHPDTTVNESSIIVLQCGAADAPAVFGAGLDGHVLSRGVAVLLFGRASAKRGCVDPDTADRIVPVPLAVAPESGVLTPPAGACGRRKSRKAQGTPKERRGAMSRADCLAAMSCPKTTGSCGRELALRDKESGCSHTLPRQMPRKLRARRRPSARKSCWTNSRVTTIRRLSVVVPDRTGLITEFSDSATDLEKRLTPAPARRSSGARGCSGSIAR